MEQEIDPTQKGNYVFPSYLQSAPRGFMDIAVARHAHSVCIAVGPATTSQACATACLASREPCAMKVSTQAPWRVVGEDQTSWSLSSDFLKATGATTSSG